MSEREKLIAEKLAAAFDIWIAKYSRHAPAHRCDAWQFTSAARMDGITANMN